MKKWIISLIACILASGTHAQQTPWVPLEGGIFSFGTTAFTAPFEFHAPDFTTGPVLVTQQAKVDFTAGQRVNLQPGFRAGDFTSDGYFHGQIGSAADFDVVFIEPNSTYPQVGQYEKLEMGIKLPSHLLGHINDYLANNSTLGGINPYDPDQISVEATFTNGIESYLVYGFYFKDFIRDPQAIGPTNSNTLPPVANWLPVPTAYEWRIRFSPPSIGHWTCSIGVRLNNFTVYTYVVSNIQFQCLPSSNPGYLRVATDHHHLEFSNGQSFFGIGQNLEWTYTQFRGYFSIPGNYNLYATGYLDMLDYIQQLSQSGGNMARMVVWPQSYEFEWEKPGDYEARQTRMWELDKVFDQCESSGVYLVFCLDFQGKYDENYDAGQNWASNPYHTLPGINDPTDVMTTTIGQKYFKRRLRYFLSRWGYSTKLGITELLSEVDGWSGFGDSPDDEDHDPELMESPSLRATCLDWHQHMGAYFKSIYPGGAHLLSTSYAGNPVSFTSYNSINPPDHPYSVSCFDVTSYHDYSNKRGVNTNRYRLQTDRELYSDPLAMLQMWDKPTITGELGLKETYNIGIIPMADAGDIEGCSDISFHNAIWSTAMMGGYGTGLNWFQYQNPTYRTDNFPAIKNFFLDIVFNNHSFDRFGKWKDAALEKNSSLETFYTVDHTRDRIFGWAHNTTYWWGNIDMNCIDRRGNTMPLRNEQGQNTLQDDDCTQPLNLFGYNVKIEGVKLLTKYHVEWYSTRGQGNHLSADDATKWSNILGDLKPMWPEASTSDLGFKITKNNTSFERSMDDLPPIDTLLCSDDTITVNGVYNDDTLGTFNYQWVVNGTIYDQLHPTIIFSQPGVYNVMLIISDSSGFVDTVSQQLYKPECNNSNRISFKDTMVDNATVRIFPNPSEGSSKLVFPPNFDGPGSIFIYNSLGLLVNKKTIQAGTVEIDLDCADYSPGLYFIDIVLPDRRISLKFIKEQAF